MTGCKDGVVGVDVAVGEEKGFELEIRMVLFTPADEDENAWLNGFVAPKWSAGLDKGAECVKGNWEPGVDIGTGLATSGVVVWACPRDEFTNGFETLPGATGCC